MTLPENLKVIRISASSRMGGKPDKVANRLLSAANFVPFSGNAAAVYGGGIPPEGAELVLHLAPSTPQVGNYSLNYTPPGGKEKILLVRGRFYRVSSHSGHLSIEGNCAPDGEWADLSSVTLLCPDPNHTAPNPEADWVPQRKEPKIIPPAQKPKPGAASERVSVSSATKSAERPVTLAAAPVPAAIVGSVVAGYKFVRVEEVDVNLVHPLPNQPRKRFHGGRLKELGESIRNIGLQQLVQVRVLCKGEPEYQQGFRYMLVDGERRLRAHKLIKKPRIGALIVEVADRREQYLRSLVLNLHQEPHSHWELAMAVIGMVRERDGDSASVSRDLGRSVSWVNMYLGLRSLHADLFALLDPETGEAKQLRLQHAVILARMKAEKQLEVYEQAVRLRTEGVAKMTSFLKKQLELHKAEQTATGHKRHTVKPSTRARNAQRGLQRITATAEALLGQADGIKSAFAAGNSYLTRETALRDIDGAIATLRSFRDQIGGS